MRRRECLQTMAAATVGTLIPDFTAAGEMPEEYINGELAKIAKRLRTYKEIARVDEHFVPSPQMGLVSWEKYHFRPDLHLDIYPSVERCVRELYDAQRRAMDDPEIGLRSVIGESYLEKHIQQQLETHRAVVRYHMKLILGKNVTEEQIECAMQDIDLVAKPIPRRVYERREDGEWYPRDITVSALAGLGAETILHFHKDLQIVPADTKKLFDDAEEAVTSRASKDVQDEVVDRRREKRWFDVVLKQPDDVVHGNFGRGHVLADDAQRRNVSLLEVVVHEIAKDEEQK